VIGAVRATWLPAGSTGPTPRLSTLSFNKSEKVSPIATDEYSSYRNLDNGGALSRKVNAQWSRKIIVAITPQ
jgi:hypothetical protein